MTTTVLAPYLTQQFFGNNGAFLAGGLMWSYQGGSVVPATTYTDATGATANSNPIVLNARGECSIWVPSNTSFKFVLQDPAGNQIWSRDNVVQSQLLTLYGGIDTGGPNAYVLNFAATFTAYTNGIVIYWTPANSNTGPSTLNVNGLGPVPIVNIDGSALGANQIRAGVTTEVMYFNGVFQLLSVGTFIGVTVGTFGAEVPIASAATTDLGTAPAHVVLITGTANITSFGSSASIQAPIYVIRFASSLTLTYNISSMILPGAASIVTTPGDAAIAEYLGSGNWKVLIYQSVGGQQNSKIKASDTALVSNATLTPDPDLQTNTLAIGRYGFELYLVFDSIAAGAGFKFTNDGSALDSRSLCPAFATGWVNAAAYGPKADTFYGTTIAYSAVSTTQNGNQVLYKGSLLVGTPGTFGISWAQNVSTASATTLRAGSYLTTTLLNTGAAFNIIQRIYSTPGTFVETVPVGYTTLVLEVWGAGGGGGAKFGSGASLSGGGGAGSGGYARTVINVAGLGGNTVNYTVGAGGVPSTNGGTSSASSGTLVIPATITCLGGNQGGAAPNSSTGGAGGTGGTSTGGVAANTTGNTGAVGFNSSASGVGGSGGFGIAGINTGGNAGGNGAGLGSTLATTTGGAGVVCFTYSP